MKESKKASAKGGGVHQHGQHQVLALKAARIRLPPGIGRQIEQRVESIELDPSYHHHFCDVRGIGPGPLRPGPSVLSSLSTAVPNQPSGCHRRWRRPSAISKEPEAGLISPTVMKITTRRGKRKMPQILTHSAIQPSRPLKARYIGCKEVKATAWVKMFHGFHVKLDGQR